MALSAAENMRKNCIHERLRYRTDESNCKSSQQHGNRQGNAEYYYAQCTKAPYWMRGRIMRNIKGKRGYGSKRVGAGGEERER